MAASTLKSALKKQAAVVVSYRLLGAVRHWMGIKLNLVSGVTAAGRFLAEYRAYRCGNSNPHFQLRPVDMFPCLSDRTVATPLEATYFYQDSWAAGRIFAHKPEHHYDVGSSAMSIGLISQFVPTTMIDIRPIELKLNNLFFREGSIVELPFPDNSIASLSSLCVVEHIGLGRYGDPVDCWGSEKALAELKRVLQPGGNLYISLPVDAENRVYFNAHRAFTREYVLELCADLELVEEKYVYGTELTLAYDKSKEFGTGLFHFTKVLK